MFEEIQRQQDAEVALANTRTTADFLIATLAVHGIHASHHAWADQHPSVDWAQGYRVTVASQDEAEARALLEGLSMRPDVVLPEDG